MDGCPVSARSLADNTRPAGGRTPSSSNKKAQTTASSPSSPQNGYAPPSPPSPPPPHFPTLTPAQGTYLGTLHDVNHLDLVGWINAARYKWAALCGREIQFRPATFYLGVADLLAREVDGLAPPAEAEAGADATAGTTAETADKTDKTEAEEAGVRALGKKVADEGTAGGASQPSREGGGRPAGARARTRTRSITDDPWDATSDRDDDDDDTTTNNNGGR